MSEPSITPTTSRPEPLSLVWRFFAAPPTLLILVALLAAVLIVSHLVPHSPSEIDDPRAWLAAQPGVLGNSVSLQAVGLFDLAHALWFRLLLALIGLCLFVWAVESAEIAWRAGRGRWTPAALALWGRHPLQFRLSSGRSPDEALAGLRAFLERQRYRWSEVAASPGRSAVAGRHMLGWWAQPILFAALILSLVGLGTAATWGWQGTEWRPAPGERRPVGYGTNVSVELAAFDNAAGEYESQVTWLEDDRAVRQDRVALDRPATWNGLVVRQVGTVPAVTVRGTDQAGQPLLFQLADEVATPAQALTIDLQSSGVQRLVLLPNQDLYLLFSIEPDDGLDGGSPAVRVVQLGGESEQETLGVLREDGTLRVQDLDVQLELSLRPVLRVDHRPGMALVVGGLALAVLALGVAWLTSPALLWLSIAPGAGGSTLVEIASLGGMGHWPWFSRLAGQLREALADGD